MLREHRDFNILRLSRDSVCEERVYDRFLGDMPGANSAITRGGDNEVVRGRAYSSDLLAFRDEVRRTTSEEWPERVLESLNCGGGAIASTTFEGPDFRDD